jgi:hypothetical protein
MPDKKRSDKDRLRIIAKYTSAAFQMAAIIVLGALGGKWLDGYMGNEFKVWTLVLTIVAVALALYYFIKDVTK